MESCLTSYESKSMNILKPPLDCMKTLPVICYFYEVFRVLLFDKVTSRYKQTILNFLNTG